MLRHILYIDDDLSIQKIAKKALESLGGFEVSVCQSGKQALNLLHCYKPDLILLDVMMPEMDGPQFLEILRTLPDYKKVPVIFISAKVQKHEQQGLARLGANGIIGKPFDPITLHHQIIEIWEQNL